LTGHSYNSAVFYIGANNEYELHAVQVNDNIYNTTYVGNPQYDKIEGNRWLRLYDTSLVSYGTLVFAVDEYRSEIENKTLTGKPNNWPNVSAEVASKWDQGDKKWGNGNAITLESSNRDVLKNITATESMSRNWIRMDWLVDQARSNKTAPNPPKFAHVSHAYAKRLNTASRIQLSLTFLIIVIVCNAVKLLTMLWVVFMERKDYIVTLGDGASSYLERPDPTTERMCILSKPEIVREVADAPKHNDQLSRIVTQSGKCWVKQYSTYSNSLNRDREVGSYFM
jgi:hypothetical protein